jgi:hypothetical protein
MEPSLPFMGKTESEAVLGMALERKHYQYLRRKKWKATEK